MGTQSSVPDGAQGDDSIAFDQCDVATNNAMIAMVVPDGIYLLNK